MNMILSMDDFPQLKAEILSHGGTQAEIAKELGVNPKTIERGLRRLPVQPHWLLRPTFLRALLADLESRNEAA